MKKKYLGSELTGNALLERLSQTCKGLVYTSETDAPVEAFLIPSEGRSVEDVLTEDQASDGLPNYVESQEPRAFFERLTRREVWHDEARRERAETFQKLQQLLEHNLRSLGVFKFGQINRAIYVAGSDDQGNVIGFRTRSVET